MAWMQTVWNKFTGATIKAQDTGKGVMDQSVGRKTKENQDQLL